MLWPDWIYLKISGGPIQNIEACVVGTFQQRVDERRPELNNLAATQELANKRGLRQDDAILVGSGDLLIIRLGPMGPMEGEVLPAHLGLADSVLMAARVSNVTLRIIARLAKKPTIGLGRGDIHRWGMKKAARRDAASADSCLDAEITNGHALI